jgi:hypothetical protein
MQDTVEGKENKAAAAAAAAAAKPNGKRGAKVVVEHWYAILFIFLFLILLVSVAYCYSYDFEAPHDLSSSERLSN